MTPEQHEEVGRLFHVAIEIEPAERDEFLRQACADDELRKEVNALLALDDEAKDFIEKPEQQSDPLATDELNDSVEDVIKFCPRCKRHYSGGQRYCADDNHLLSLPDPYKLIGQTLAEKYLIEALVGVGGMGAVYSARQVRADYRVAFKILQPNLSHNKHMLLLFKREVKAARRIDHENIVKIKDAGHTTGGLTYLVVEWLDGETLAEYLAASSPLSLPRTAEIIRQVAAALEAAHARHVVHRDLKPSNIMIVKGRQGREQVKVLDFGIAKIIADTAGSPASAALGTPQYASPEQLQVGKSIDGRSDIYSLGVLLYQMLTGRLPFDASSVPEFIRLQLEATPPSILEVQPELPTALAQLVSSMLAKDPSQRPQRASEIVTILDQIIHDYYLQFWFCPLCGQQNQCELKHCLKCRTMQPGVPTSRLHSQALPKRIFSPMLWLKLVIGIGIILSLIGTVADVIEFFKESPQSSLIVRISDRSFPVSEEDDKVFQDPEMLSRAPRGKAVFEKLPPIPDVICNPAILRCPGDPVLSLMVTETAWNQLSKDQQIDLTWYLQSLIPTVRANPDDYIIMLKFHETSRKTFIDFANGRHRNLCGECWEIFIGDPDDGSDPPSLTGPVIVRGDFAWERGKSMNRSLSKIGIKASAFRK